MTEKVKVLVFGGCGFLGRHIVAELLDKNVALQIRVVDKVPPPMAWLNSTHQKLFDDPRITFKSANLMNSASCEAAFQDEEFDWVINAAGETKIGLEHLVYREGIFKVSTNIAKAAANKRAKIYLEISSGQMGSSNKKPFTESDDCNPWSAIGKCKHEAEQEIRSLPGLNWIIVRPAIIYGPGDKQGLTPRLLLGAISHYLGSQMELLWDQNLKMNTVHVKDVARAVVWLCQRGKTGEVYNLVDEAESTQDTLSKVIADIFNIKYKFCGNILSKAALVDGEGTVQLVNEKHLEPWSKMCTSSKLYNTPLTPYIDMETLNNKHLNIDGSKIRKDGFEFQHPKPTYQNLIEVLDDYTKMGLLPKDLYSAQQKRDG